MQKIVTQIILVFCQTKPKTVIHFILDEKHDMVNNNEKKLY